MSDLLKNVTAHIRHLGGKGGEREKNKTFMAQKVIMKILYSVSVALNVNINLLHHKNDIVSLV